MESCPKVPMLSFELKMCNYEATDLAEKVYNYIFSHYQENPQSFQKEINDLVLLRENAVSASKDFMGLNILKKYYSQLGYLSNRFPMKTGEECETEFSWDNLYNGKEHEHTDVRFELACILYNIGAMHSYLGCLDSRQNDDGIKISCTHFQYAAWAFKSIRELFSAYDFTSDLSEDMTSFKMNAMLAQAQECVLEKSIIDNRKTSINAKISCQIIEFYQIALVNIEKPEIQRDVDSKIRKDWKGYCQFKINYYRALTNYYSAISSEELQKIGEAVGYIQKAQAEIAECAKIKNFKEFKESLKYTTETIEHKAKLIKKDNDFVYNEKIVAAEDLPEVKGASLVKCLQIDFDNLEDNQDLFGRLVSMKAHEISSLYSEEKAKLLRQINDQVEEKNGQLNQFMQALQINQLHLDNFDYLKLPKQLLECCASLSVRRSLLTDEIPKAMKSIVDISVQTKETLQDIEEAIEAEEREHKKETAGADQSDDSMSESSDEEEEEARAGSSKTPRKAKLREISRRYDGLQKNFVDANASNTSLHEAFSVIIKNLQILSMPLAELTENLPAIEPVDDDTSKEVREKLVALLGKVEEMKSQREELLRRFQKAVHEDDLTKTIASHQNEIAEPQSFFQEQLKKHEQLVTYLQQNLQAQDNILRALADANALFTTDRKKILAATQQRNAFIDSLVFSYQSLDELFEKASKGVAFFDNLNKSLKSLLKEAQEFCNKSREEREARQRLMQRFSTGQHSHLPSNALPSTAPVGPVFQRQINKPKNPEPSNLNEFGSTDRPRLKDFLPHMKPDSWGNAGPTAPSAVKQRPAGPPQVDRTSFAPTADAPFHQNQFSSPQKQIQMQHGFNQISQAPQNNQLVRPNFQPGMNQPGMSQPGMNQPGMNYPSPRKPGPVGPPQLQNPASFHPFLGHPQIQPQSQSPQAAVAPAAPHQPQTNPVFDQRQQLFDKRLYEQQQKEKEIQQMKQQLEQQEQQLKYQQQQFMLQQEKQQQYLKMLEQEKSLRQNQQPAVQPSSQYQQPNLYHQESKQAVPNASNQYPNHQQPQQPFHSHPGQYSAPSTNISQQASVGPTTNNMAANHQQPQMSMSQLNQQPFGPAVNQSNQQPQLQPMLQPFPSQMTNTMMNGAARLPETKKSVGMPTLQPAVSSQAFKPDSVYKPGFYTVPNMNQNGMDPNQQAKSINSPAMIPNVNASSDSNKNAVIGANPQYNPAPSPVFASQTPINANRAVSNPPYTAPSTSMNPRVNQQAINQPQQQQQQQQQSSNIPHQGYQPNLAQQQQAPTNAKPANSVASAAAAVSKPSAIDDLLDIFDGSSLSSTNVLLPTSQQQKPTESYTSSLNLSNVSNASDSIYDIIKAEDAKKSSRFIEQQQEKQPEAEIAAAGLSEQPSQASASPSPSISSANKLNFLNSPAKLESILNEVQRLESHVCSLNKKTLSQSTQLEREWKELNDYQESKSFEMTISVARCYPNKNRFQDLLPYDQTRVVLHNKNDDYINATFMGRLIANETAGQEHRHPNFITAQAPILSSPSDLFNFWSMVVQQQVELVCCLCRDSELVSVGAGPSKAGGPTSYWPLSKESPLVLQSLRVSLLSVRESASCIKRVCSVANTGEAGHKVRTVVLLQHKHGQNSHSQGQGQASVAGRSSSGIGLNEMAEDVGGFLKFIKECEAFYQQEQRNASNPVLVHCMNGVSRSAVFLAVYSLIQVIDSSCAEPASTQMPAIADCLSRLVKAMRHKRKYMLQTTYHLKYSYDAILYYLKDLLIKQGVLTNLTSKSAVEHMNAGEPSIQRQQSIDSNILSDMSLVSIQDSVQPVKAAKPSFGEAESAAHLLPGDEAVTKQLASGPAESMKLEDLCNPSKFTIGNGGGGGGGGSDKDQPKKANKITKDDFFKVTNKSKDMSNDPFFALDPLRKQ